MRKHFKRTTSIILSLAMAISLLPGHSAGAAQSKEDMTDAQMKEYLRTAVSDEEYPDGVFGIAETRLTVKEGKEQTITILRQGNTDTEQKVRFKAVDVSAVYGQDYLLNVKHSDLKEEQLKGTGDGHTLLEEKGYIGDEGLSISAESEAYAKDEGTGSEAITTGIKEEEFPEAESSLMNAYAAQNNGEEISQSDWKEVNPKDVSDEDKDQFDKAGKKVKASVSKLKGVETILNFEPGEYKKDIVVETINDDRSESDEQIAFFIFSEGGSTVGEYYNGYVNIEDNDKSEKVTFEVKEKKVNVDANEDKAKVTIVRKSGLDQIAVVKAGTKELSALAGEDYEVTTEDILFAPGVEEKDFYVPITGDRKAVKKFYVGIMLNGEVAEEDGQAAVITICKQGDKKDESLTGQSKTKDVEMYDNWLNLSGRWGSHSRVLLDARAATKITVNYDVKGSHEYKDGCSTKTSYSKSAKIGITRNYDWQEYVVEYVEAPSKISSQYETKGLTATFTRDLNDVDRWSALNMLRIVSRTDSANTYVKVNSVKVEYGDYTFYINNDSGNGHYKEQQITGFINKDVVKNAINNDSDDGKFGIRLGTVYVGNDNTKFTSAVSIGQSLNLNYEFTGKKNSQKVEANGNTVDFKGYYLALPNSTSSQHSELMSLPSTLTYDFLSKYKKYLFNNGTFQIYPVFEPKPATVTLSNYDKNKGLFLNFSNQSQKIELTKMDSIKVDGAANPGNGVKLMELISTKGKTAGTNKDSAYKSRLVSGLGKDFADSDFNLNMSYEQAKIKVMYDPSYDKDEELKDKGQILYTEKDANGKTKIIAKANMSTGYKMELNNISIGKTYNFISDTDDVKDPVTGDTIEMYETHWRDGNTDYDEDGQFESTVGSYKVFTPVIGNVMPLVTKTAMSRVYFNFQTHSKVTKPQDVIGHVLLQDKYILTGYVPPKKKAKGLNGVTVTCDGIQEMTTTGSFDGKNDRDGFFRIKSRYFGANDYRLVHVMCDYGEDGKINTCFVVNPAIEAPCYVDTEDEVKVDNAHIYKYDSSDADDPWKELKVSADKDGYYGSLTNGNNTYKVTLHAAREGMTIKKATMKFYDIEGHELLGKEIIGKEENEGANSGVFSFEFNPAEDVDGGLGLPAGTTVRVNFVDNNGNISIQRELGLKFKQSLGPIELLNSFSFGGADKVIKLIGSIDGVFNLGWSGKFDEMAEDVVDDNGVTTGEKRISYGYSKELINKSYGGENPIGKAATNLGKADQAIATANQDLTELMNNIADGKYDGKFKGEEMSSDKAMEKAIKAVEDATDARDKAKKKYEDTAKTEQTKEKSNTKVTANVKLELGVSFAVTFGEQDCKYYFENMMVTATVKGEFSVKVEFATPIGVTIYMKLTAGGEGSASFIIEERTDALTKYFIADLVDANNNQLDIFDCNPKKADRKFNGYGQFSLKPFIDIAVGAGIVGCSVELGGRADFDMKFYTSATENTGKVNLSARLTVTILCFDHSWPFVSKDFQLFGSSGSALDEIENKNYLYQTSDVLEPVNTDYMKDGTNWNDAGISAQSLDEDEESFAEQALGDKIKEHPGFEMITLDDTKGSEKYLAVFLSAGDPAQTVARDANNDQAAYYCYYSNGAWSTPVMIEDDGSFDQEVRAESLGSRGAIITWSTAPEPYTSDMDKTTGQNKLNIHAVFVGKDGQISGDIQEVTHETAGDEIDDYDDFAADVAANVSYDEASGRMVVYYQKKEYSYTGEELLGDVIYPRFAVMSARFYDFTSDTGFAGNWKNDYSDQLESDIKAEIKAKLKQNNPTMTDDDLLTETNKYYAAYVEGFYGQDFFEYLPAIDLDEKLDEMGFWEEEPVVQNISSARSVIIDSDAVEYDGQGLFAYTIDKDGDLKTLGDREIILQRYNFADYSFNHPIVITADNVEDANVRFVEITGKDSDQKNIYLAWLHNGDIVGMNVSRIIKNKDKLLVKYDRDNNGNTDAYYLNKTAPSSTSQEDVQISYIPPVTYVKGEVADVDGAKSEITGFDVNASDSYVYFVWTQNGSVLEKGIEENSAAASDPVNTRNEEQLYTARYDITNGDMTKPVQVTSKFGTYYRDVDFVVEGEDLVGLVYKAGSRLIDWQEFNRIVKKNNQQAEELNDVHDTGLVEKNEVVEEVTEDSYTPYYVPDIENAKPVTFRMNPIGKVKIKNAEFVEAVSQPSQEGEEDDEEGGTTVDEIKAGDTASLKFDILNDGVGTAADLTVTAKDNKGSSVLYENDQTESADNSNVTAGSKKVNEIKISSILGGDSEQKNCYVDIPEDAKSSTVTIQIRNKNGDLLASETVTKELEGALDISDLKVESTENRNEYIVSGKVENTGTAKVDAGSIDIGARKQTGKDAEGNAVYSYSKYAEVAHDALIPGQVIEFTKTVIVNPTADFVTTADESGNVTETGELYAKASDSVSAEVVTRESPYLNARWVKEIKDLKIAGTSNNTVDTSVGETILLSPQITSNLTDKDGGIVGDEGLQYRYESEDESIADVSNQGALTGNKIGTTKIKVYAFAKDSEFVTSANTGSDTIDGTYVSSYLNSPESLIYSKEITVKVAAMKEATATPTVAPTQVPTATPEPDVTATPEPDVTATPVPDGTATPVPDGKATPTPDSKASATPAPSGNGATPAPTADVTAQATPVPGSSDTTGTLKTGSTFKAGNVSYKVVSADKKNVSVTGGKNKKITKVTIPAKVKKNGVTYKVTAIAPKAFNGYKALKTIIVKSASISSIGDKAFKGIYKKAVFKVVVAKKKKKTVKRKLKKKLTSKTGFQKTMKVR